MIEGNLAPSLPEKVMRRLASLAMAMLFSAISLCATDLTITYQVETRSLLAGKTTSEVHYYTPSFQLVRDESARTDTLVDYQKAITYTIDHEEKKITMLSMDDALAALESMSRQEPAGMGKIMASVIGDPDEYSVAAEGTEQIAGRKCTTYKVQVARLEMLMSVDPTLSLPVPASSYSRMMKARAASMAKAGPTAAAFMRLYEEMGKIKGVPLKTKMSGYGGVTNATHTAVEIKQGSVAASLFTLPAYPIEDLGKKMREQAAKSSK